MFPGRRYWFWSLAIGEILAFAMLGVSVVASGTGYPGDLFVIVIALLYWTLLCCGVACAVAARRLAGRVLRLS